MNWLFIICGAIFVSLVLPVFQTLIADEVCASLPYLSRWLVKTAVRRLPPASRARYDEEWSAELLVLADRKLRAMFWACSVLRSSRRMRTELLGGSDAARVSAILEGIERRLSRTMAVGFAASAGELMCIVVAAGPGPSSIGWIGIAGAALVVFAAVGRLARLEKQEASLKQRLKVELSLLAQAAGSRPGEEDNR